MWSCSDRIPDKQFSTFTTKDNQRQISCSVRNFAVSSLSWPWALPQLSLFPPPLFLVEIYDQECQRQLLISISDISAGSLWRMQSYKELHSPAIIKSHAVECDRDYCPEFIHAKLAQCDSYILLMKLKYHSVNQPLRLSFANSWLLNQASFVTCLLLLSNKLVRLHGSKSDSYIFKLGPVHKHLKFDQIIEQFPSYTVLPTFSLCHSSLLAHGRLCSKSEASLNEQSISAFEAHKIYLPSAKANTPYYIFKRIKVTE